MKTLFRCVLLALLGVLTLIACSPATDKLGESNPPKASEKPPDQATPAQESQIVGYEGGLYPPQNLALIASTGRPQFIHSYADWWTTCQINHPIVNGLKEEFGDRLDFIDLNIDVPETLPARERFNIVQRSQYLVADPQGNIVQLWYGVLNQEAVEEFITGYLAGT